MLLTTEVRPVAEWPISRQRDGSNPIERKAVYRAQLEIRSMPASLVVQIALWPDKLADWAKETAIAPSVVYNMLANVKPYHRVRTLLARRLNVPKDALDHLIEAPRPEPLAKLPPEPPEPPEPFAPGDRDRAAPASVPPRPSPPRRRQRTAAEIAGAPGAEAPRHPPSARAGGRRSERRSPSQIALNL